jgi:coproporphyrinogen III oxidase-like Fe-S oxidoreductase
MTYICDLSGEPNPDYPSVMCEICPGHIKRRYHRIDAIIRVPADDDSDLHEDIEHVLDQSFDVVDLSIYEIAHMPSYAEQEREEKWAAYAAAQQEWDDKAWKAMQEKWANP